MAQNYDIKVTRGEWFSEPFWLMADGGTFIDLSDKPFRMQVKEKAGDSEAIILTATQTLIAHPITAQANAARLMEIDKVLILALVAKTYYYDFWCDNFYGAGKDKMLFRGEFIVEERITE